LWPKPKPSHTPAAIAITFLSADLAAGPNFALILRLRQVEELYVRALYAMFVADEDELAHILSDEFPNSFAKMYRDVNAVVLEGRGALELEHTGPHSGVFTAMDTIDPWASFQSRCAGRHQYAEIV
jgi:hypothetical protein